MPTAVGDGIASTITRAGLCCFGFLAILWGIATLPTMLRQSVAVNTAKHIIQGDTFKDGALDSLRPAIATVSGDKWSRPSALSSVAIITLRYLEEAMAAADQAGIDPKMVGLDKTVRESLANAPADPFLWLVLFWLENTHNGFSRNNLKYLRMSYQVGPSEGWVAVRRNRLAVAIFSQLPPDMAEDVVGEFSRLVESKFYADAADILTGPGWPVRDRLLAELKDATDVDREIFAKTVYRLGYDVAVPGVDRQDFRPWK
jgi:hypothetical protein